VIVPNNVFFALTHEEVASFDEDTKVRLFLDLCSVCDNYGLVFPEEEK